MGKPCIEECPVAVSTGDLCPWQDVPTNDSAPFIHRFPTDRQTCVYDGNTRRILPVWPVLSAARAQPDRVLRRPRREPERL